MADDPGALMRHHLWSCSLAALIALGPTTAAAGLRPCRLPLRSAAAGIGCNAALQPAELQYPAPRGLPALVVGASLFAFGIPTTIIGSLLVMNPDPSHGGGPSSVGPH